MQLLKANTAVDVLIGPFVDSTDGNTAETALTLSQADIKLSKNGQALAQKNDATAAAHDANGYYNCELDATDTNTEGTLVLIVHESGALPIRHEYMVLAEAAYDSLFTAKDSGYMDVNIKAISEDTTAADNAELAFDGTGYGFTNCTIPTVTTLTGHTAQTGDSFAIVNGDHGLVSIQDDIDAILVDTNELQSDWANGGRLDLILDELTTQGDTNEGKLDTIDGNVDTILVDTNELQTDDVPGLIAALNDPTAAAIADAVWDEAKSGHVGAGSFGEEVQAHSLSSEVSALNNLSAAEVNAEVDTALSDYDAPTKAEMDSAFTEIKGATWASGTDTLEAIRDRGDAAWITATGFSTHAAADVKTAIEASGSDLDYLVKALVNKAVWTESNGNLEMFSDAGASLGTVTAQIATDGTYTTRKRAVI